MPSCGARIFTLNRLAVVSQGEQLKGYGYACSALVVGDLLVLGTWVRRKPPSWPSTSGWEPWSGSPWRGSEDTQRLLFVSGQRSLEGRGCRGSSRLAGVVVLDARTGDTLWEYGGRSNRWQAITSPRPSRRGRSCSCQLGQRGCELLEIGQGHGGLEEPSPRERLVFSVLWNGCLFGLRRQDGSKGCRPRLPRLPDGRGEMEASDRHVGLAGLCGREAHLPVPQGAAHGRGGHPGRVQGVGQRDDFSNGPSEAERVRTRQRRARKRHSPDVCRTPPVLSGGRLYCRNASGDLVCLDLGRH